MPFLRSIQACLFSSFYITDLEDKEIGKNSYESCERVGANLPKIGISLAEAPLFVVAGAFNSGGHVSVVYCATRPGQLPAHVISGTHTESFK